MRSILLIAAAAWAAEGFHVIELDSFHLDSFHIVVVRK